MIKKLSLLVAVSALVIIGCEKKQTIESKVEEIDSILTNKADSLEKKAESLLDGHNSRNSLDVIGTYKGTLPCPDCKEIKTVVVLGDGDTYTVTTQNIAEDGTKQPEVEKKGKYTWADDGNRIELDGNNGWYKIEENRIVRLDKEGNPISEELRTQFTLTKQ